MTAARDEIAVKAYAIAVGLTDLERIALGGMMIQTVLDPQYVREIFYTAAKIREHAEGLHDLKLYGYAMPEVEPIDLSVIACPVLEEGEGRTVTTHALPNPLPDAEAQALANRSRPRVCRAPIQGDILPRVAWSWFKRLDWKILAVWIFGLAFSVVVWSAMLPAAVAWLFSFL